MAGHEKTGHSHGVGLCCAVAARGLVDEKMFCKKCDYDLSGLKKSGRCPKCGTEFREDDPRTFVEERAGPAGVLYYFLLLPLPGFAGFEFWFTEWSKDRINRIYQNLSLSYE